MPEDKLDKITKKLDGMADDVRTASYRIDKLENRFDLIDEKIDTLTNVVRDIASNVKTVLGQLSSIIPKIMDHEARPKSVESRISVIEAGTH
jgi:peptidoglycan hydrolase CwlO-like protein